jgi:predicted GNAT family acetyltransferase
MPVRRIAPDEWARWRDFRYAMLQEAPYAFGSTYAEMVARPDDEWRERATALSTGETQVLYLVEEDGEWLACAGGYVEDGVPNVFGVWTRPDARGRRLAETCIGNVVEWARQTGATEIRLWATDTNTNARRVYDRLGFTPTGVTQPLPSDESLTESEYALPL